MGILHDQELEEIALSLESAERKGIEVIVYAARAIQEIVQLTEYYLPDTVPRLVDDGLTERDAIEYARLARQVAEISNIIYENLGINLRFSVTPCREVKLRAQGVKYDKNSCKRKEVPKTTRVAVFKRDEYRCQWCGATPFTTQLEIDHIVPVSRGGKNDMDNLRTLCKGCNDGKGSKLDEEV